MNKLITGVRSLSVSSISKVKLRDYQQDCIDTCLSSIASGKRRIGVSLATGGGKTVIFANLIKQFPENQVNCWRTLVLVHRRELAQQAAKVIKSFAPELNVQIDMGNLHADAISDVVVASVQSLVRGRLYNYDPAQFKLIIIDEAHHAAAKSYLEVLSYFGADQSTTQVPVVGFSATLERADNKALSKVMDEIVFHRGIIDMIEDQWLCEAKFTTVTVQLDLQDVGTSNGDYVISSLSNKMNTEAINKVVLKTYLHKCKTHNLKSTILFGVDVLHVQTLYELFQKNGINAQYVTAKTRPSERDAIVQDFKEGKIDVLMNCGIFTEGTDMPNIDCILLARPTRSRTLLIQMIGRGLRLHHGKEHCHVIDFIGSSNVGVLSAPTLAGLDPDTILDEESIQEMQLLKKHQEEKKAKVLSEAEKEKWKLMQAEQELQTKYDTYLKDTEALDVTLTTFKDFKAFANSTTDLNWRDLPEKQQLQYLLQKDDHKWVRYASDSWALSIDRTHHLRVTKEKDTFFLSLHYDFPKYMRDDDYKYMKFGRKVLKKDTDLIQVVSAIKPAIDEISGSKSLSKYAMWRSLQATPAQKKSIEKRFKVYNDSNDHKLTDDQIKSFSNTLSKGAASDLMFALGIAPKYPFSILTKSLLLKHSA